MSVSPVGRSIQSFFENQETTFIERISEKVQNVFLSIVIHLGGWTLAIRDTITYYIPTEAAAPAEEIPVAGPEPIELQERPQ